MIGPGTHLPRSLKIRVFLRSLLLQASWNPKGMQNLGLVYALFPALQRLYPDPLARREAVQRHLTFFNTHPYVAAAIVGGVLYHEERI
ncbi:MAG: PTS system mannose/fructose/sorbose family transporter subunit IID, partial [Myxococcaceae bacterium]